MAQPNQKKKSVKSGKPKQSGYIVKPGYIGTIFLGIILLVVAIIRIRLLAFPLERDEGEYAYFGQLILQGIPPYKLAYNLKLPGTYYCYAMIMSVFGQTRNGIHFGLLLFNMGSICFLYFIAKKLFSTFVAVIAAGTFGLMDISFAFLAQAAHATQFVTFFMLAGTFFLVAALDKNKLLMYLIAGCLMSLAFIMKQSGVFFSVFGGLVVLLNYFFSPSRSIIKTLKWLGMYITGVVIPLMLLLILMSTSGVFDKFWFWTITYPGIYGSRVPLKDAWGLFKYNFASFFFYFIFPWISAGAGAVALLFYKKEARTRLFAILFLLFSILPVIPGFYFRSHYFIPLLPAIGLMTGIFFDFINQLVEKYFRRIVYVTAVLFGIYFFHILISQKDIYFLTDTPTLCKIVYGTNPFNESIPIARYIEQNTLENENIMVLGSEPQIYFYANRKSSTGYIYMYDLVFKHPMVKKMQEDMFKEVEKANPRFLVFVNCTFSWLGEKGVSDTIMKWTNGYLQSHHFRQTGLVDIPPDHQAEYVWNEDIYRYKPKNETTISIFRREDVK